MAADTRVDDDGTGFHATKIFPADGAILGMAGHNEACMRFLEWWPKREDKPLKIPKRLDWSALVLTHSGLLVYDNAGIPDVLTENWAAIGTGRIVALAAMDTMRLLGRVPDPRIALRVACHRDSLTGGTVEFMRLKRRK